MLELQKQVLDATREIIESKYKRQLEMILFIFVRLNDSFNNPEIKRVREARALGLGAVQKKYTDFITELKTFLETFPLFPEQDELYRKRRVEHFAQYTNAVAESLNAPTMFVPPNGFAPFATFGIRKRKIDEKKTRLAFKEEAFDDRANLWLDYWLNQLVIAFGLIINESEHYLFQHYIAKVLNDLVTMNVPYSLDYAALIKRIEKFHEVFKDDQIFLSKYFLTVLDPGIEQEALYMGWK